MNWKTTTTPGTGCCIRKTVRQRPGDCATSVIIPLPKNYESQFRLRCKDGRYKWIQARGTATRTDGGKLLKMVGSHIDITDKIKKQQQLEEALKQKNVLLSEIHHRVKNNLAVVSSILQLQLDRPRLAGRPKHLPGYHYQGPVHIAGS